MSDNNPTTTPKQKLIYLNTKPTEQRDKLFVREVDQLKKELSKYYNESANIVAFCKKSFDIQKINQIKSAIQSQE